MQPPRDKADDDIAEIDSGVVELDVAVLMQRELKRLASTGADESEFRHIAPSHDDAPGA